MEAELEKQSPLFQKLTYPILYGLVWLVMVVLGPVKIKGRYRVPKNGGLLVLSNHLADIDPFVVQLACPRKLYFMSKSELFSMKVVGYVLRLFRAFPVKRGEPDRGAIKKAIAYLRDGEPVGIFPEGELSETGELLPIKPGIALIARMTQVPIVCLGIVGTNRVLPYGAIIPRPGFRTIRATWGEPRQFTKEDDTEAILSWVEGQLRSLTMLELG